jgi:HlyD family secretion protein
LQIFFLLLMLTQPITPNQNNSVARTLKIMLVDDQKSIQLKLQEMLSSEVEFQIVGIADDGETAIAQIESLQPDVLLLDIEMPKMNGIQTAEIVSQRFPNCRVLVLSSHEDREYVQQAIAAGADGYILKNSDPSDLVVAIHSVSKGYSHFAPKLLPKMQLAKNIQDRSHLDFPQPTSTKPVPPRRRFYWQWLWSSLGILVLVSAIAVGSKSMSQKRVESQPNIKALTAPVETQPLTVKVEASGTIEPIDTVNVSSEVAGRLAELYVDRGDQVKAGDTLARLDSSEQQAQLAQAQGRLAEAEAEYTKMLNGNRSEEINRAQAQLTSAQARVDLSAKQLERNQFLAESGAIAQLDLDEIIQEDQTNRASLQEAQQQLQELTQGFRPEDIQQSAARVTTARAELQEIQSQLNKTTLKAPFDGIVTQKHANIGAIITPTMAAASDSASATPSSIIELASGLEVLVNVPEANIGRIKTGQPVDIIADAYSDRTFKGTVRTIEPEAVSEDDVTSFRVRVRLNQEESLLRSGMNVDAIFIGEPIPNAMLVPTVAVTNRNDQMGVLVPDAQGQAKFQPVTVGVTQDGKTQIVDGLKPEQRVFIDFPEGKAPETLSKPF